MKKLTYISLFSGAGVGCYGFKSVGFECIATCELKENRIDIQKLNEKCKYDSGYIVGDLSEFEVRKRLYDEIEKWRGNGAIDDVDVIIATPPCQGMSTANFKKKNEMRRNSLVVQAITIIEKVKPKIFVLENVSNFLQTICTDDDGNEIAIENCIHNHLSRYYHIYAKVINFKDYGVPSSRPRTIVVASRKDCINISPLNIFPSKRKEISLRKAISDLPSLSFGEIDKDDIYHMFRPYPLYMEEWISHIKEGHSAFENEERFKPYKLVDGERTLLKGAYLGNKYRRLTWDKPCACIMTRNDQLASQSTIHPNDNRVLSIRELMRVMTIPDSFKWVDGETKLQRHEDRKRFLKKNELNIRRCIGEAVPTAIMEIIAKRAKEILDFENFVKDYEPAMRRLDVANGGNFYINTYVMEKELTDARDTGSYYTPQSVVYEVLSSYKYGKSTISILEPAVGLGAFLPQLFILLQDCERIKLDVCDLNRDVLNRLKEQLQNIDIDWNRVEIRYINDDFLSSINLANHYDVVITNPPFLKVHGEQAKIYRNITGLKKTSSIEAFFLRKILNLADEILLILPKNFLMSCEYDEIRSLCENYGIVKIVDFGVAYFKKVFLEIISIHFKKAYTDMLEIVNKSEAEIIEHNQRYIFHEKIWMIYRDEWFDDYIRDLRLGVFDFFRDRQLSNKYLTNDSEIRVLRSKNILDDGTIVDIEGYDKYISKDVLMRFNISKYLNSHVIIMPNFTYNTRAAFLPPNCVPNGSIAVLLPLNDNIDVDALNLRYYSSEEFRRYYSIVKNKAKFTLNIDKNSIYYIGIKENG